MLLNAKDVLRERKCMNPARHAITICNDSFLWETLGVIQLVFVWNSILFALPTLNFLSQFRFAIKFLFLKFIEPWRNSP